MWLLYQSALLLAWPWVLLRLRWRARREPAYGQRIEERFGHVPASVRPGPIWFHAVSAGETLAAAPLISALASEYAQLPILVTTMTPTGSRQVAARLEDRVDHCYAPYDFPWAVGRFFDRVRPRLLVLMETELWPNLVAAASRRGIPVVLINARLSEKSMRGYRRTGRLVRRLVERLHLVACQYPDDAERFRALGTPADRIVVHGNLKFDAELPADHEERVEGLARRLAFDDRPVWIAASTHAEEEPSVLRAHLELLRNDPAAARLILVPRHPSRAGEVESMCWTFGLSTGRSSAASGVDADIQVVIGDTMGELIYFYGLADAAFVGGSLNGGGGHNPIEPALCGRPVAMGPDVFNFANVVSYFRRAGCLVLVSDAEELAVVMRGWLNDPTTAQSLGARARLIVTHNRGAFGRLQDILRGEIRAVA